MGIQGLLPLLKSIQRQVSVQNYAQQTVGVDSYCWLHKGVYGCAKELIEGKETKMYVNYCMKRIDLLLHYNITPIMVFDGDYLPSKMRKEEQRKANRQYNKSKGLEYLRQGKYSNGMECLRRAVDITPSMALDVIQECRKKGIECIVAPYEADAQLAYLSKTGLIDAIITEDSDLLVYGCKRVLFKMDSIGNAIEILFDRLQEVKELNIKGLDVNSFRHLCILSGCDYLPSIPGMGLKTACKVMRQSRLQVYKALQLLRRQNVMRVPKDYESQFKMADETFLYQVVFDPITKTTVPFMPYPQDLDSSLLEHAGRLLAKDKAIAIAYGNVDPISGEIINDYDPVKTEPVQAMDTTTADRGGQHDYLTKIKRKRRQNYPIQSVISKYMKLQSPPAKLKSQFQLPRSKSLSSGDKENLCESKVVKRINRSLSDGIIKDIGTPKNALVDVSNIDQANIGKKSSQQSKYFHNVTANSMDKRDSKTVGLSAFRQKCQKMLNFNSLPPVATSTVSGTVTKSDVEKLVDANGSIDSGLGDVSVASDSSDVENHADEESDKKLIFSIYTTNNDNNANSTLTTTTISSDHKETNSGQSLMEKIDIFSETVTAFSLNKNDLENKRKSNGLSDEECNTRTRHTEKPQHKDVSSSIVNNYVPGKDSCRVPGLRRTSSRKSLSLKVRKKCKSNQVEEKKPIQTKINLQSFSYRKINQ